MSTDNQTPGAASWKPLTKAGQVQVGDKLQFTIGDKQYSERAKLILHAGTEKEEVIYDKGRNFYFITAMVLSGFSNHKNMQVQSRAALAQPVAPADTDPLATREQAEAWMAVADALHEVAPGWQSAGRTGMDAAIATIKRLAGAVPVEAPQAEQAQAEQAKAEPKSMTQHIAELERAAEYLEHYAKYCYEVKPDDIERHPYIPAIEEAAENLRAIIAGGTNIAAEEDKWEPIETAPKTGRTLLLGRFNELGNWRTMRGQWFSRTAIDEEWEDPDDAEEGWYETAIEPDVPNCWSIAPTHWMPLPKAPADQQAALTPPLGESGDADR